MPDQPANQAPEPSSSPFASLPSLLTAWIDGIGYSVEVSMRQDIGERRCRDMGFPLFVALSLTLLLALLAGAADLPAVPDGWPPPLWWLIFFELLTIAGHVRHRIRARRRQRQGGVARA